MGDFRCLPAGSSVSAVGGKKTAGLRLKVLGRIVAKLLEWHLLRLLGADTRCFWGISHVSSLSDGNEISEEEGKLLELNDEAQIALLSPDAPARMKGKETLGCCPGLDVLSQHTLLATLHRCTCATVASSALDPWHSCPQPSAALGPVMTQPCRPFHSTMLHASGLPKTLWGEALLHVIWVKNRSATQVLDGKTPYKMLYGKKPHLGDLLVWGAKCWILDCTGLKLDDHAKEDHWVGYDSESTAHQIYLPI